MSLTALIILKRELKNLKRTCKIFENDSDDSFFNSILYLIYYTLFEFCQESDRFLQVFGEIFLNKIQLLKPEPRLNLCLGTFQSQCYKINDLLMEKNLFLRVYELRKKIRYLMKILPKSKNSVKFDLLTCSRSPLIVFQLLDS